MSDWCGKDEGHIVTLNTNMKSGNKVLVPTLSGILPLWSKNQAKKWPPHSLNLLWCWRWLLVFSAARRWPPGRSWSLRTTKWATRWRKPASQTWGNTAAAPTPTCPEPEKPACPTCCSVWSLLYIEVSRVNLWACRSLSFLRTNLCLRLTVRGVY